METLPVELLHHIFDKLDAATIIFSIRPLSKLFRSVVSNYDRFILDMKLISKAHFHVFCRLIKPENVISLILSNDKCTSDQIDLFISLVNLGRFTRLRSLFLLNIDQSQLNIILKQIQFDQLTLFSFSIRKYDYRRMNTTNNSLTAAFAHSHLRQLEFDIENEKITIISLPPNCTIQYLSIKNSISVDYLFKILQSCSHLHTIIMKDFHRYHKNNIQSFSSPKSFPQLTSLAIEHVNVDIDELESFLLLTPSLTYLKLIDGSNMVNGKRWEQFIQANLPRLDKFEFFFGRWFSTQPPVEDLELIRASFQTPFWREYKKWFVAYEYDTKITTDIYVYSIPLCKSFVTYKPGLKNFVQSACPTRISNETMIMNNVKSLSLKWNKFLAKDIQKRVCYI
jgi:hypothetical protein